MRVSLGGIEISVSEICMIYIDFYSKFESSYYFTDRVDYIRFSSYLGSVVFDENVRGSFFFGGDSYGG